MYYHPLPFSCCHVFTHTCCLVRSMNGMLLDNCKRPVCGVRQELYLPLSSCLRFVYSAANKHNGNSSLRPMRQLKIFHVLFHCSFISLMHMGATCVREMICEQLYRQLDNNKASMEVKGCQEGVYKSHCLDRVSFLTFSFLIFSVYCA